MFKSIDEKKNKLDQKRPFPPHTLRYSATRCQDSFLNFLRCEILHLQTLLSVV